MEGVIGVVLLLGGMAIMVSGLIVAQRKMENASRWPVVAGAFTASVFKLFVFTDLEHRSGLFGTS